MTDGSEAAEPESSARLEQALQVFLQHAEAGGGAPGELLARHPELRDLLEPMLGVGGGTAGEVEAESEVLGDFRLVRELGRGGMGIVYEAWQRSLDRPVALKVLAPALMASPSAVARSRREAAAVGKLRHPGIVEVHGFGSSGERHWFAMGLVDGEPLTRCFDRFRTPAAAVALLAQVLDALHHAHGQGLVHRDVKPGNVMVAADGTAVLTDFGLAHDAELPSVTTDGSFLGTLDYASPEQVQGGTVDVRSDLWSVGVMLYELLAGQRPFARTTATATMKAILTEEPPSLRRANPLVPVDLAAIVDAALRKEPARRYPTAAALLADLRAFQSGGLVSARAPGLAERALRWARREPWRATTLLVVALGAPLLSASLAYLGANAPRIAAATAAEQRERREDLLGTAWQYVLEDDRAAGLRSLDSWEDDGDMEIAMMKALLRNRLGQPDRAQRGLSGLVGPTVDLVRRFVAGDAEGEERSLADTHDAFECFVRASIAYDQASFRAIPDKRELRRAFEWAGLAVALAPQPRLNYFVLWGIVAKNLGEAAAAEAAARALQQFFPSSRAAWHARTTILTELDPQQSLALLAFMQQQGVDEADLHNNRGVALERLGRHEEAEAAYRAAIARRGDYGLAWINLGSILRTRKQPAAAVEALQKATSLVPNNARAWNLLGVTLRAQGDRDGARAALERAVSLRQDYAIALYNLGNLEFAEGRSEAARELFSKAVAADPKYVQAIANLGNVLKKLGRKPEALGEFLRAALVAPNDVIPAYNVARTALELGLPELALVWARRAREVAPEHREAMWLQVEVLLAQPVVDGATMLALARVAAKDGKAGLDEHLLLARAFVAGGDRPAAIARLEAAVADPRFAKDPKLATVRDLLAELRAAK